MEVLNKKILLASKSPRRKQLLEESGFQFEIVPQSSAEDYPSHLMVEEIAPFLAQKKARSVNWSFQNQQQVLLAADSVVILEGKLFEKPADRNEAIAMLSALSGKAHLVITGVCLKTSTREVVFAGRTKVYMSELTEEEMAYYVDTYQPFDKAGSYGVQEWIGLCKIDRIEGTYSNVMGLPMDLVYRHLKSL